MTCDFDDMLWLYIGERLGPRPKLKIKGAPQSGDNPWYNDWMAAQKNNEAQTQPTTAPAVKPRENDGQPA